MPKQLSPDPPAWIAQKAPHDDLVLFSECSLARNLGGLPFTAACSEEERRSVESRVREALTALGGRFPGEYIAMDSLSLRERRYLAERHVIGAEFIEGLSPRGVYVCEEQGLSVMLNGPDHVCIRQLLPGLQLNQAWNHVNQLDNALASALDFAFHPALGFLTSSLSMVGTGLKMGALFHLPGLAANGGLPALSDKASEASLILQGVFVGAQLSESTSRRGCRSLSETLETSLEQSIFGDTTGLLGCSLSQASGDLYFLVNRTTLGISESEIVFQLQHLAGLLLDQEEEARRDWLQASLLGLEDRVGRARALAGGARLMGFSESLALLSSLRLGIATGVLKGHNLADINGLLFRSQWGQLESKHREPFDVVHANEERAKLFRNSFN
ncbi:MAG: hypothetical protein HYV27_02250 [Candidatus Hydrogenedentes bacterium]|nr:hypothetical protein [Candidatus Hydrogenedentota bacterium]